MKARSGDWMLAGIPLLLLLCYTTAYLTLLDPLPAKCYLSDCGSSQWMRMTNYRCDFQLASIVFHPAERVDRWLRPTYWNGTVQLPNYSPSIQLQREHSRVAILTPRND